MVAREECCGGEDGMSAGRVDELGTVSLGSDVVGAVAVVPEAGTTAAERDKGEVH